MADKTNSYNWKDSLPLEFDPDVYVSHPGNKDISTFNEIKARRHYESFGRDEGRICSSVKSRKDFIDLIPVEFPILEIGPFFTPAFIRPAANVYYLDVLSTHKMKERAATIKSATIDTIPEIDYVWAGQRYAELIEQKFSIIYSSHNIEHQPCFITHLHDIESVLAKNGAVFLSIPDKRYCFDHFFHETQLTDVIQAWVTKKSQHYLKDILDHHFFATHNNPIRHWQGDHGINQGTLPIQTEKYDPFLSEISNEHLSDAYNDVHAWKFTPLTFNVLFENLFNLKLSNLQIIRTYPTLKNSNEFYAVLINGR